MKSFALAVTSFCLVLVVSAGPSARKGSIVYDDHHYFTGPPNTLWSRERAVNYCHSEGGELAKVTNKPLFDKLRLALPGDRTYWIDGIEKQSLDRFALNNTCTSGEFDYSGFIPEELRLPARSCLVLVNVYYARIEAMDCIIPHQVLCSLPLNGCDGEVPQ